MSLRSDAVSPGPPQPLVATKCPVRINIQMPASALWFVAPRLLFTARSMTFFVHAYLVGELCREVGERAAALEGEGGAPCDGLASALVRTTRI
jgi:hypothetical protein